MLLAALAAGAVPSARAADFACRAEVNRTSVPRGNNVILTVTAEGDVSLSAEFTLPAIDGVKVFRSGTNQSVSFVNGVTNTTIAKTFYLQVEKDKDFVIPPVAVVSQGETCRTEPIAINVTAGQGGADIPVTDTGNRTATTDPVDNLQVSGAVGGRAGDDIFITLETDQQEVWAGQQVLLIFKYFRRIQPWNNPQYTPPRTEGFWREDLGEDRNYRQMVQGRSYTVTEIRYALFPSRTGDLEIQPAELAFPDQGLDRFFSSRRRGGPRVLRTEPVTIRVRELPAPRPADFSGLVATHVRLTAQPGRTEVPRGEPFDLKVALVSDGFLKGFDHLAVPEPVDARQHDAGNDFSTRMENGRLFSRIDVEKVVVPGRDGALILPPVSVTWFDAVEGKFTTSTTRERTIKVLPSDLPYDDESTSGFLRTAVSRLGQDLIFIHRAPDHLAYGSVSLGGSPAWWLGLLLPVAGLGAWRLYLNWARARNRDPVGRRRRLALKISLGHLDAAAAAADAATRLAGVDRAVTGYVADHLNLPAASIGTGQVLDFCEGLGEDDTGRALCDILARCDGARFGGDRGGVDESLTAEAATLLKALDAKVTEGRRRSAADRGLHTSLWAVALLPLVLAAGSAQAAPDPLQLMAEANQAYTEGDLDQALEKYLAVRAAGVNDAVLHFNLGNTHARRGDLGLAVASYLRAQRLDPRDRDIRTNLHYVRTHLKDLELGNPSLPLFIAQFAGLARALTVREWGAVLVILVWLLSALLAWGWYREGFSDPLRRAGLVLAAILVLTVSITVWRWYGEEVRQRAVVVVAEASVYSGPAETFPVMFQVHDGLTVHLEAERGEWRRINLGGKSLGWLPAASLEAVNLQVPEPQGR